MRIQRVTRKSKINSISNKYMNIYRTSSSTGKFYGTARKYKLTPTRTIDYISMRPIIFNIGTVSHQPSKHLAKLLYPLCKLEYTVANNIESINNIKSEKIPTGHSFLSFDVKYLFANILLDHTINIILRIIYDNSQICTDTRKK